MYLALGRRLRNLVIVEGNVLWADQGIYKVERLQGSDEAPRTTVHNLFQDRRVENPEDLVRGTFGTLAAGIGNFKQCPDLAASIGIDPDLVMCKEGPGPSVFINEQRCIRTCRYWSPGVCI